MRVTVAERLLQEVHDERYAVRVAQGDVVLVGLVFDRQGVVGLVCPLA